MKNFIELISDSVSDEAKLVAVNFSSLMLAQTNIHELLQYGVLVASIIYTLARSYVVIYDAIKNKKSIE